MLQFPDGPPLAGARLDLKPLRVEHAVEMFALLSDPGLHVFIGGEPASLPDLRERYRRQVVGGSTDGSQRWINWVVRRREDEQAVGTVQATVSQKADALVAEVAWVIASPVQGNGYGDHDGGLAAGARRGTGAGARAPRPPGLPEHRAGHRPTATVTVADGLSVPSSVLGR